jgi:hypothetical protein
MPSQPSPPDSTASLPGMAVGRFAADERVLRVGETRITMQTTPVVVGAKSNDRRVADNVSCAKQRRTTTVLQGLQVPGWRRHYQLGSACTSAVHCMHARHGRFQ